MVNLKGNLIFLRALEPEDIIHVYNTENDTSIWEVSHTQTPYSHYVLKQYLEESHKDIYEVKQLRLVICNFNNEVIGFIDLFDFDPQHKRAGVGLVINNSENRGKGYGKDALEVIIKYCFSVLNLHQIYCNITEGNDASVRLFKSCNFEYIGCKKDWIFASGQFKNEQMFQLINS